MKKHYMLFTLLFTLLPFLNSYAEENKAISIPQPLLVLVHRLPFGNPRNHLRRQIRR